MATKTISILPKRIKMTDMTDSTEISLLEHCNITSKTLGVYSGFPNTAADNSTNLLALLKDYHQHTGSFRFDVTLHGFVDKHAWLNGKRGKFIRPDAGRPRWVVSIWINREKRLVSVATINIWVIQLESGDSSSDLYMYVRRSAHHAHHLYMHTSKNEESDTPPCLCDDSTSSSSDDESSSSDSDLPDLIAV